MGLNKLVPQHRLERGFNKQVALMMEGRSGGFQQWSVNIGWDILTKTDLLSQINWVWLTEQINWVRLTKLEWPSQIDQVRLAQ